MPTTDCSSPTTTRAVNEKRRPPLTTLATRLISITRSCRSRPWGLTVSTSWFIESSDHGSESKFQTTLAGALRQGLHPAVVLVPAAVEQARVDPCLLRPAREELTGLLGLLERSELAQVGLRPGHRCDSARRVVV